MRHGRAWRIGLSMAVGAAGGTGCTGSDVSVGVEGGAINASRCFGANTNCASTLQTRQVAVDPSTALAVIGKHAGAYPHSTLREEREALRIEALIALGRSTEARARLATFEAKYPRSVYRRRLKSLAP